MEVTAQTPWPRDSSLGLKWTPEFAACPASQTDTPLVMYLIVGLLACVDCLRCFQCVALRCFALRALSHFSTSFVDEDEDDACSRVAETINGFFVQDCY